MTMLNNFIYAQTKDLFLEALNAGNILDEAIVFIEDTKEIWNHGHYFAGETTDASEKQDVLVSGVNIKTIDGESILGDGNIVVHAQSDWNDSDSTSKSFIKNKPVLSTVSISGNYDDLLNKPTIPEAITVDEAMSSSSTNPVQNKIIKSYIDSNCNIPVETTTSTSQSLIANKYYKWTNTPTSITITLETPSDTNILNNYMFEFTTSSSGCTLSVPSTIKWINGTVPTIEAGKTYQISIINNLATVAKFE